MGCVVDAVQVKMFYEILMSRVVVRIAFANHRPTVHDSLFLSAGHFVIRAGRLQLGSYRKMLRSIRAHFVGIKPSDTTNPTNTPTITQSDTHGVVSHTGQQPDRPLHFLAVNSQVVFLLEETTRLRVKSKPPWQPPQLLIVFLTIDLFKVQQVLSFAI